METKFLQEWNESQFKAVEKSIVKYLDSRWFETLHSDGKLAFMNCRKYSDFENVLGLAYTSSSDFAGLWVCNTDLYLDNAKKWHLIGFALDENSFVHSIWWDNEENEICFPIN